MIKSMRRNLIQFEGERSTSLDLCRNRLSLLGALFTIAFSIVFMRTFDLCVIQGAGFNGQVQSAVAQPKIQNLARGNIYDRQGVLLATTIKSPSLYADPALILEPEKIAAGLVAIFPQLDAAKILKNLKGAGRFVWIKRHITPAQQEKVLALGEPGLAFYDDAKRIYPLGASSAHMVGYTDLDGNGLAGIERGQDVQLKAGRDVRLSLDIRLQHAVKREVQKAMDDFSALAGAGMVMDVQTGEVLAGVSLPDYDLNFASKYAKNPEENKERLFNRLTLGVYELGSMFKIFSSAAFLETQEGAIDETFDVRTPIRIGRFKIDDYKGKERTLSMPEVFIFSSNIGTASMGRMVGGESLEGFYRDLGLLDPMKLDISEVGKPRAPSSPWKEISVLTASYGHGVSTTPLQMGAAVASVVNGGLLVQPKLVLEQDKDQSSPALRILSAKTSETMRKLLRLVVTHGTGSKADIMGYVLGGKTGTAEKSVNGKYEGKKLISSFVGAFPMDNPRYVVMVMVDEPKGNAKSYGYATAGWVAAPAVGRIVTSMASILGIPADMYDPARDIGLDLIHYVQESYDGKKVEYPVVMPEKLMKGVQRVSY